MYVCKQHEDPVKARGNIYRARGGWMKYKGYLVLHIIMCVCVIKISKLNIYIS